MGRVEARWGGQAGTKATEKGPSTALATGSWVFRAVVGASGMRSMDGGRERVLRDKRGLKESE